MLILFDIDLTLLNTGGSGARSMLAAGRELFGPQFSTDGVPFAGRLDPLIISDLFTRGGVPPTAGAIAEFTSRYQRCLAHELARTPSCTALPGVLDLITALDAHRLRVPALALGILTGNFEPTGTMKLDRCGIPLAPFEVRVWGDHSPNDPPRRSDLVPVAMRRYESLRQRPLPPADVVVIGDTPHDVHAALSHGCRALAVTTGRSSSSELRDAGAHLVVPDLSDTSSISRWLLAGAR
ncbi:MAG: HAD family hydrolase [Leptolyngbya sp. PLA1]|nr:HAD family hydrolase [Leptolyngbya sp. PLA1]